MIRVLLSAFALLIPLGSLQDCGIPCPNYYWRDFNGVIPGDAFIAATEAQDSCKTLYLAQVYFREWQLLAASIDSVTNIAVTEAYGNIQRASENVKILCSPTNEIFEWVPIHTSDLRLYYKRAILGGFENGNQMFFGRVKYNGTYVIGKVFKEDIAQRGLWIQRVQDSSNKNFLEYELLAYNCSKLKEKSSSETCNLSTEIE